MARGQSMLATPSKLLITAAMPRLCIVARHLQGLSFDDAKNKPLAVARHMCDTGRMTHTEIQTYLREVQLMSFAQTYSLPLRTLTRMRGGATSVRPATVAQVVACIYEDKRRAQAQQQSS